MIMNFERTNMKNFRYYNSVSYNKGCKLYLLCARLILFAPSIPCFLIYYFMTLHFKTRAIKCPLIMRCSSESKVSIYRFNHARYSFCTVSPCSVNYYNNCTFKLLIRKFFSFFEISSLSCISVVLCSNKIPFDCDSLTHC
jgi:hypothetical protein